MQLRDALRDLPRGKLNDAIKYLTSRSDKASQTLALGLQLGAASREQPSQLTLTPRFPGNAYESLGVEIKASDISGKDFERMLDSGAAALTSADVIVGKKKLQFVVGSKQGGDDGTALFLSDGKRARELHEVPNPRFGEKAKLTILREGDSFYVKCSNNEAFRVDVG